MVVIQARLGSKRLPRKMLLRLGEVPVIEWVIRRLLGSGAGSRIVLAIPMADRETGLVELARKYSVDLLMGSETDVLSRYFSAASLYRPDWIVRVCADNPFVCPEYINKLVEEASFHDRSKMVYLSNHKTSLGVSNIDGFGGEIASLPMIAWLHKEARSVEDREHIFNRLLKDKRLPSDWIVRSIEMPQRNVANHFPKLDVDTAEDLISLNRLVTTRNLAIDDSHSVILEKISHGLSVRSPRFVQCSAKYLWRR